ncbi:MAG: DMT family transporter [Candidatus Dormiibacterota bacterium]
MAAVAGAMSFGLASALQHVATMHVPVRPALRPSLILDLLHEPVWTASLLLNLLGSALQILALANGPLALVEPMLVTDLLFATLMRSLLVRRLPPAFAVVGATLCCAGLAAFLALAQPPSGSSAVQLTTVLPYAVGLGVLLLGCLTIASRRSGEPRALSLALAAGVLYGVTAGAAKVATGIFATGGVEALLTNWPIYAMAILGPTGFLLNQNAFQSHPVMAPTLAVITVTDPLVSIGVGVLWLHETLHGGVLTIIGEVLGLVAMAVGVWLLAHGAQHVIDQHRLESPGRLDKRSAAPTGQA